jgi:hypothetical protein
MTEDIQTPEEKNIPKLAELVERLEKANAEAKAIQEKNEELAALNLIGGKTDAGIQPPAKKEETPKEYKDRILRGGI